ncbi:Myc-type, basic helix-loop-helix (bHLH) domain [Phaffia rhodozyma]|uniref:Myc-type, basic helix-loop-helix (BHLH) domain n=1 Tax=Phaffia rhodozyma TaxID=264483 RepID=A0A0F7SGR7_PHARH|nr:Myc-type, basic helix-loop-helix (bHLH) domain [Phaffia rhodozyma]
MNTRSAHLPTPSPSPNLYPVATSPVRRRSTCSQYGKSNHNLPPPSPPALCLSNPSSHPSVQSSDHPVPSARQTSATSKKSTRTQRKINHSIIEKRRRVRINDCLEALRSLVPGWDELKSLGAGAKEGEDEDGWVGEGKGAGKEFKLEVLMRKASQDLKPSA